MRLTLILFLFAVITLPAQDYLVTHKGDTLKGTINLQLNGKVGTAVVKGEQRFSISAINTRLVFSKGKFYKPVQFNSSIQFMEILVDGYLSLLAFQPPNLMTYDGRLLQKRDGSQTEIPSLGFRKIMSAFLSDHTELSAKIQDGALGPKDLQAIIRQYNDFILGNNATQPAVTKNLSPPVATKLDLIMALRNDIEKSDLTLKQDAIDILNDWAEKVKTNKPAMPYMLKALKATLSTRADLLSKLDEMLLRN